MKTKTNNSQDLVNNTNNNMQQSTDNIMDNTAIDMDVQRNNVNAIVTKVNALKAPYRTISAKAYNDGKDILAAKRVCAIKLNNKGTLSQLLEYDIKCNDYTIDVVFGKVLKPYLQSLNMIEYKRKVLRLNIVENYIPLANKLLAGQAYFITDKTGQPLEKSLLLLPANLTLAKLVKTELDRHINNDPNNVTYRQKILSGRQQSIDFTASDTSMYYKQLVKHILDKIELTKDEVINLRLAFNDMLGKDTKAKKTKAKDTKAKETIDVTANITEPSK